MEAFNLLTASASEVLLKGSKDSPDTDILVSKVQSDCQGSSTYSREYNSSSNLG
jgi:hypothetical protein